MVPTTGSSLPAGLNRKAMIADTEMDEFAPVRFALLSGFVLLAVLIYVFCKVCWRRRQSRVSNYDRLNMDSWNAALLSESD